MEIFVHTISFSVNFFVCRFENQIINVTLGDQTSLLSLWDTVSVKIWLKTLTTLTIRCPLGWSRRIWQTTPAFISSNGTGTWNAGLRTLTILFVKTELLSPISPFCEFPYTKTERKTPFCGQERNAHGTGISFCEILYSNVTMLMSPPANVTLVATRSFTLSVIQTDSC